MRRCLVASTRGCCSSSRGANTPGIIKYPFWRMTAANKNACYVSINPAQQLVPDAIAGRALSFACGVDAVI